MDSRNHAGADAPFQFPLSFEGRRVSNVDYGFWLSAVIVPGALIIGSMCIRGFKHAPQSSATDIFSFLVVLDFAILVEKEKIAELFHGAIDVRFLNFALTSVILSLIGWALTQFLLEEKLIARHNRKIIRVSAELGTIDDASRQAFLGNYAEEEGLRSFLTLSIFWLSAWGISLSLVAFHVTYLSGRKLPWF